MPDWRIFSFEEARPARVGTHTERNRLQFEKRIAKQTAFLLGQFGKPEEVELDLGDCLEIADPKTVMALECEPIDMEDGDILTIGQLPVLANEIYTEPGVHSLMVEDENGRVTFGIAILDPISQVDQFVTTLSGGPVDLEALAETVDALYVVTASLINCADRNIVPYDTSMYPLAVSDVAFEAIIAQLY